MIYVLFKSIMGYAILFFFQKKKQKALFCFAEDSVKPTLGVGMLPDDLYVIFFFFQKKKQKALFCFAEDSAKPTLGVWGRAPRRPLCCIKY
jgi:hypothetical protein